MVSAILRDVRVREIQIGNTEVAAEEQSVRMGLAPSLKVVDRRVSKYL